MAQKRVDSGITGTRYGAGRKATNFWQHLKVGPVDGGNEKELKISGKDA